MNYSDEPINLRQSDLGDRIYDSKSAKDKEYQEKLDYARDLYEQRLSNLNYQVQRYFEDVNNDDIFHAMKESSLSQGFASQRAKELLESIMSNEKELTISKLQDSLIQEKGEALKLEYERQKQLSIIRDLEDKVRRESLEKERIGRVYHEMRMKVEHTDSIIDEKLKIKDLEWSHKVEDMTRSQNKIIGNQLLESEEKIKRLQIDNEVLNSQRQKDLAHINDLCFEIDTLKSKLEDAINREEQWKISVRSLEDNKNNFKIRLEDLIEENNQLKQKKKAVEKDQAKLISSFQTYQSQYEELTKSQQDLQGVIKNSKSKNGKLKQKVKEQRSKLLDIQKDYKNCSDKLEEAKDQLKISYENEENLKNLLKESEDKLRETEKSSKMKIDELKSQYDLQIINLQTQVERKTEEIVTTEMKIRSDKEKEIRSLLQSKSSEIERDFIPKVSHQESIDAHEKKLAKEFQLKIDRLARTNEDNIENLNQEINKLKRDLKYQKDLLKDSMEREEGLKNDLKSSKTSMQTEIKQKNNEIKELNDEKLDILSQLEKASDALDLLRSCKGEESEFRFKVENELMKSEIKRKELEDQLNYYKQQTNKYQEKQEIMNNEFIEKRFLSLEKEKSQRLEDDLEKSHKFISKLENQIRILEDEIDEITCHHSEARNMLKESQTFTKSLTSELENKEKLNRERLISAEQENFELKSIMISTKEELEYTKEELLAHKAQLLEKGRKYNLTTEKIWRNTKFCIQSLKSDLSMIKQTMEFEISSFNAMFKSIVKDLSIKFIEKDVHQRKTIENKVTGFSEDIKREWRNKLHKLEESLIREEIIWWDDPDMENVRKAVKLLIDKKKSSEVMADKAKESAAKLKLDLEEANRQNQKLHIRLQANTEAFDNLQKEVTEGALKIKTSSQNVLRKSTSELQAKYEKDLEKTKEDLRKAITERSESEFKLRSSHQEELEKVKSQYEKRHTAIKEELENERLKSLNYERQVMNLQDYIPKERHFIEVKNLENRILELEGYLEEEREQKEQVARLRKNDVQDLSERIHSLRFELAQKEDKLGAYIKENRASGDYGSVRDSRKSPFARQRFEDNV